MAHALRSRKTAAGRWLRRPSSATTASFFGFLRDPRRKGAERATGRIRCARAVEKQTKKRHARKKKTRPRSAGTSSNTHTDRPMRTADFGRTVAPALPDCRTKTHHTTRDVTLAGDVTIDRRHRPTNHEGPSTCPDGTG